MTDIFRVNFKTPPAEYQYVYQFATRGRQPLSFAADAYRAMTGRIANKAIGAYLKESDNEDTISEFINTAIADSIDIIVFGITYVSDKKKKEVSEMFRIKEFGYKEIPNVYKDRLVFGLS